MALYIAVTLYKLLRLPDNFPKFSSGLFFLQSWPVYSSHPVFNGHLAISQGWPLYTVIFYHKQQNQVCLHQ